MMAEARRVRPTPGCLRIGTMVEVPALLFQLPDLLHEVDFVSIGSNDLLQFLFAADRGTPALYDRYDFLSPPVLDVLEHLMIAANAAAVPVSVCGEAASKPLEALVLAALGVTSLSMPASTVLPMKAMLAQVDLAAFRPVLAAIRRSRESGLREPITTWARERGLLT
jgi:phosphotransferase system enzyme I (PtsP)